MSIKAEKALLGLLTDKDSLDVLLREGFNTGIMPTEELGQVVDWSMTYISTSGKAPTVLALTERFGDLLSDMEVDVSEIPEESIEWAVEQLTFTFGKKIAADITRSMAREVATSTPETILEVLSEHSAVLGATVSDMAPQTTRVDMRERGQAMLDAYELAASQEDGISGLTFGLTEIDHHYGGIRDGEVAVFASPAKVGKSAWLIHLALNDWRRGRSPALVTLENSIEMTEMRFACQALHLDYQELERGTLSAQEHGMLVEWVHDVLTPADNPLHILQPPPGQRTAISLVQQAQALSADSLLVDQLTFVEPVRTRKDLSKAYEVAETMRHFKTGISSGRHKMPLALAHQVTRDGVKSAGQTGRLQMSHMADSSEVERAADMLFGLYASEEQKQHNGMELQALAVRRVQPVSYDLHWRIHMGFVNVQYTLTEEDLA